LTRALRRSIPRFFGDMTNQQGPGAWRGYHIESMFSLDVGTFDLSSRPPHFWDRARHYAQRRCGRRTASRSWAAVVSFPNAGSARYGDFVLFAAKAHAKWRVYGYVNAFAVFAPTG
jgi:hypothetical protein